MTVFDFTARSTDGVDVPLAVYRGKVLLVVNTATKCGFTPQYFALESLYRRHKDAGLEILDFPCNQFASQAPGSDDAISEFCKIKYDTTFPRFTKVDVNGKDAHPLFVHLKAAAKAHSDEGAPAGLRGALRSFGRAVVGEDIKWNFTKFLVDREGQVVARFGPMVKPEQIEEHIRPLLQGA